MTWTLLTKFCIHCFLENEKTSVGTIVTFNPFNLFRRCSYCSWNSNYGSGWPYWVKPLTQGEVTKLLLEVLVSVRASFTFVSLWHWSHVKIILWLRVNEIFNWKHLRTFYFVLISTNSKVYLGYRPKWRWCQINFILRFYTVLTI